MLNKKVEQILNDQVEKEGYSSHLYLAMASWAEGKGLPGTAKWLYAQADEERIHMLKLVVYINDRGGQAVIPTIKQPPKEYGNIKDLFKAVLDHEQFITASINDIVAVCMDEKDFTTHNWIQWFVNEQIEEERSARDIIDKLALVGDNRLYEFDRDIISLRKNGAGETAE